MTPIESFLSYCSVERGLSANTVSSYRSGLNHAQHTFDKELEKATPDEIREYLAGLRQNVSTSTVARHFYGLKGFYRFAQDEGIIVADPMRAIRAPKQRRVVVRSVTAEEISGMMSAVNLYGDMDLRNRALFMVGYGSGLRVSELRNLRLPDIDIKQGIIAVHCGKGEKDRLAPMNAEEIAALDAWLTEGRSKITTDNDLVFVSTTGRQLTRQAIYAVFKQASLRAVGRVVSPHKFRHAFTTDLINGGADIRTVQVMLGHSSINTTMRYLHSSIERLKEMYQKFHPRGTQCKTL